MKSPGLLLTTAMCFLVIAAQNASAITGRFDLPEISAREATKFAVTVHESSGGQLGLARYDEKEATWYFDFPERNKQYLIKWPGGETTVTSPTVSSAELINYGGATVAASLGIALVATMGNYSEENSSFEDQGPAPTLIPTCAELVGLYTVTGPKIYDTCEVAETEYAQSSQINCVGGSVTMVTVRWGDSMTGQYDEEEGSLVAVGSNSSNAALSFEGTAEKSSTESNSSLSIQGNLTFVQEDGCSTTYDVTYYK